MPTLALVLVSLGVVALAGRDVTQRWLLRRKVITIKGVLVVQHAVGVLAIFPFVFIWKDIEKVACLHVRYDPLIFWLGVGIAAVINVVIQYASAKARELGEISLVAPINALTPGLVAAAALLLGERLSLQAWIGIALISGGIYTHAREGAKTLKDWLQPLTLRFIWRERALRWAYLAAVCGTIGLIGQGLAVRSGNLALAMVVENAFLMSVFSVWSILRGERLIKNTNSPNHSRQRTRALSLLGLFWAAHAILIPTAFRLSPIAVIGTLKRITIVLQMPLAWYFLGEEKAMGRRLLVAIAVTTGAILLALDKSSQMVFRFLGR